MTGTGTVLFEARHIRKTFPGVQALAGVDFDVRPGEIHALLGVNGAGKSTLVKVISGAYAPDAGEMVLRGQRFAPRSTTEAIQRGVAVVYQERTLIPSLTAAQNVLLGVEPTHLGVLDERRALLLAREIAERLGVDLDLSQEVRKLGAGERQIVDILRVLRGNPALIILDEPTAALTRRETDRLFALLRGFRERGMGVVFVSHRLDEVFAICDRATVLRDGRVVATAPLAELTKRDVVRLMVSEDVATVSTPACGATVDGEVLLQLVGLSGQGFQSVDVEVRRGEVVGLAGAVGAGCTALLETIVGFRQPSGGRIVHRGHGVRLASPADAAARGIVLLPEKRSEKGLIERLSVRVNLALPSLRRFSRLGVIQGRREHRAAQEMVERLRIATPHLGFRVGNLSGGNKQKVAFGKWLMACERPEGMVFLFDEPTEGVDVGTKAEMWAIIRGLARDGAGVVVASSELDELFHLSDRIYVLRAGRVVACVRTSETTQDDLLHMMLVEHEPPETRRAAVERQPSTRPSL